jgi:hypothetical protein
MRFKDWGAMRQIWRHDIPRHGEAFRVICIVCQLAINSGEKLFECRYRDPPYEDDENEDEDGGNGEERRP